MMTVSVAEESGVLFVEGTPNEPLMARADDASVVLEECFSNGVGLVLLYAKNLTEGFFDLSSGEAAAILQKLRNYRVRLAVVCPPGAVRFSTHFGEMVAEEQPKGFFGVFETRSTAVDWLRSESRSRVAPCPSPRGRR
jgi:hypothetical protein